MPNQVVETSLTRSVLPFDTSLSVAPEAGRKLNAPVKPIVPLNRTTQVPDAGTTDIVLVPDSVFAKFARSKLERSAVATLTVSDPEEAVEIT